MKHDTRNDIDAALDVVREFVARARKTQRAIDALLGEGSVAAEPAAPPPNGMAHRRRRRRPNGGKAPPSFTTLDMLARIDAAPSGALRSSELADALGLASRGSRRNLSVKLARAKNQGYVKHRASGKRGRGDLGGSWKLTSKGKARIGGGTTAESA